MKETASTFPEQVRNNVRYLLHDCADIDDTSLHRLDAQRSNLLLAVDYGLRFSPVIEDTGNLMAAIYPLIERRGYVHTWLPLMQQAVGKVADPLLRLQLQSQLGHLLTMERHLDDAVAVLTKAVQFPLIQQDIPLAARTHLRLGTAYFEMGNLDAADEHARLALSFFSSPPPAEEAALHLGLLYNLLGQIALMRGDYRPGIQYFQEAINFFQTDGDITYLAGAYANLGMCKQGLKETGEAIAYYRQALALLAETPSELQKCRVNLALGDIYLEMDDLDRAEEALQAANSPFMQQSGDAYLLGFVNSNLAVVEMRRENYKAALILLDEADRLWAGCSTDLYRGHVLETKAGIYERWGELEKALAACNQAETLLAKFNDQKWPQRRLDETRERKRRLQQLLNK